MLFIAEVLELIERDVERMDWREQAACRGEDPELFFPLGSNTRALRQAGTAKLVCAACQVSEACLAWALKTKQLHGVWGGLDEVERRIGSSCG